MSQNNNILYNAALGGVVAGMNRAWLTNATATNYSQTVLASKAIANEVDSLIATDTQISATGGGALPPTTDSIITYQLAKSNMLSQICNEVMSGRATIDATAGDYATVGAGIVALYTEAIAQLVES
jgi:hypothetical protein